VLFGSPGKRKLSLAAAMKLSCSDRQTRPASNDGLCWPGSSLDFAMKTQHTSARFSPKVLFGFFVSNS
jgi:hypothetical protein